MKLISVQLKNYKSVVDSGEVLLNEKVTIFAGKNNTGKTALLESIYRVANGVLVDSINSIKRRLLD